MRLFIQHQTHYDYDEPAALGPHLIRLRPATHTRARVESYSLRVSPEHQLRWQQDPFGNHVARLTFPAGTRSQRLDITVELAVEIQPVNPFDFFVDDSAQQTPFTYPEAMQQELAPFLELDDACLGGGPALRAFLETLPRQGHTVELVTQLNAAVSSRVAYVIREEAGIYTPEETLTHGRGSCRDSAVLLIAALRSRGLAARFASGYLLQLTDEGMIPDEPRGVSHDVVDLHAWAEVFLPGAGWIGLDATSGLMCGEGHIPLACTARPFQAAPLEGTSDHSATGVSFQMTIGRLGHEARPTAPYAPETWQLLLQSGDRVDAALEASGLCVTTGGEPTLNSREFPSAPEWNTDALGATKWTQGLRLAAELRKRIAPGAATLRRMGKHYPGESLPRWALELVARRDGVPVWTELSPASPPPAVEVALAERFAAALAERLGLAGLAQAAYEDPWAHLVDEQNLPPDVDPHRAKLDDPEERRRLARVLHRGLATQAGFVLPLARVDGCWTSERWETRREHLYLIPGDSPMGLRLPLRSLRSAPPPPEPPEFGGQEVPPDPRASKAYPEVLYADHPRQLALARHEEGEQALRAAVRAASPPPAPGLALVGKPLTPRDPGARTAVCVEPRERALHVFLPPLATGEEFLELVGHVRAVRDALGATVQLEGYPPPSSPELLTFAVTPDPGVLEVNIPPSRSFREHAELLEQVFEAGLHAGLHSEKYLLDGRLCGSGGGHHITLGGPTTLQSPWVQRPDLLASLLTFTQHHPSLSYMFSGLFVGPTSQAPRPDEARHDSLYELELALPPAFDAGASPPPWLADLLFRHLLVDMTGNTHRAEICIDKLFDPQTRHGRQGIVELRAFEMPSHHRMASAQVLLLRALVAAFARAPYRAPLVRWGMRLQDQFLLPYWLWRDFEEVLAFLDSRGLSLPAEAYRPFVELRCPLVGRIEAGGVVLEVRNAIEPWNVLGEELTTTGTSRYVDSSLERLELRVRGLVPERHRILVNGHEVPLVPTGTVGEGVVGVRFRAWAPPHSLHAHIGVHHPVRVDLGDAWQKRSLAACAYHVWHPLGRGFEAPPLTRFEAAARRAQRFTAEGPLPWPVSGAPTPPAAETPYTVDLRRIPVDRPPPRPLEDETGKLIDLSTISNPADFPREVITPELTTARQRGPA